MKSTRKRYTIIYGETLKTKVIKKASHKRKENCLKLFFTGIRLQLRETRYTWKGQE